MTVRLLAGILTAVVLIGACTTSDRQEAEGPTVTVFGPYRNGEAAGFAAAMRPFENRTGIDVRYVGTGSISADLPDRLAKGNAPDVAIIPQPALVGDLVARNLVVPLAAGTEAAVHENYSPSAIDLMTFEDDLQAVFYRASVKSLVWYPPRVFAQHGYEVPSSWDRLLALTERMKTDGFAPWCFSMESFAATGWVATDWVEDLLLRLHGPELYEAWVAGDVPFSVSRVIEAFHLFDSVVRPPGHIFGGTHRALSTPWSDAADPMFTQPPQCLLHRQASFYRSSLPDELIFGEDWDVFILPPTDPDRPTPILVAGDLAVGFTDRPEVQALLTYLATPESGQAWAEAGGYNSAHKTFDPAKHSDPFEKLIAEILLEAEVTGFDGSDRMPPQVGTGTFRQGMVNFVQTGDLEATIETIQAGYHQ